MKLSLLFICGLLPLLLAPRLLADTVRPQEAAQASAESWLVLIDAGKYAEGWQKMAGIFQKSLGQERFVEALGGVRTPFGKANSRKLISAKYTDTMPGAPDGEYVILQYETAFEFKKSAVETITPMKDKDGTWKVSGYYVK